MKHFKFSHRAILKGLLAVLCLTFFSACDSDSSAPEDNNESSYLQPAVLNDTAWFTDDVRIDFLEVSEELYLNYLPDGLNTSRWIKLVPKVNTSFDAEIVWSADIREIGKKFSAEIGLKNGLLCIQSDEISLSSLSCYEGVSASSFDSSKVAALETDYLSNFEGSYTLDSTGIALNVGAKINLHKDDLHYWNGNVLNAVYDEEKAEYDFLLAHTSQKDASGSIDPGITGEEPFISEQGLFWSHMTLTAKPGSVWEIAWSSDWKNSPYEALNAELNMKDTFTGPATSKIKYSYKFYFGTPSKDESGWCIVEKGELIYSVEFESDLPVNKSWQEIYEEYQIESKISLPENMIPDYWWYSTNSITSIEDSFVYKLNDSYKPSLESYEFYLALKEKPAQASVYTRPGKFYNEDKGYLEITETTIQWNESIYEIVDGAFWTLWPNDETNPNRVAYLVEKDGKNYLCSVWYYINKPDGTNDYVNFNPPLESSLTKCPAAYDYKSTDCNTGTLQRSLKLKDSSFWCEIVKGNENPLFITGEGDSIDVKSGSESFTAVFKEKGNGKSLSMPASDGRMEMEVNDYLWLSDSRTPGKVSYPVKDFYELQLTDVEYMGWCVSFTKGTWDYDEEEDEYSDIYSIIGNYVISEKDAESILRHFTAE